MSARRARGFVLLPVIITALLVATVALLLNLEAAAGLRRDAAMQDGQRAEQVLEAAFTHAEWALAQSGTCSSYATLAGRLAGSAGEHAYTVAVNPSAGSPVTLAASVTLASGATRTRARAGVPVYAGDLHTLVLQPGAAAGMDAVIDANRADRNYGAGTTLEVKKAARLRSLLGFPLTELPPAVRLERAVLELYAVDGTGHAAVSVAPLLGTWSEGTCVKGNCSPADGVTWNTRDGAVAWGAPGGDSVAQASVTGDAAAAPWIAFDVSAMLRERLAAGTPRADFLLADGDNAESSFASSDDADAARHPRLVLSYRCACGIDCAPPAAVARCDADFVPDLELARYPAADLGLGSTIAAEHVPAGAEYAGVSVPDGGGLLLADFNAGVIALAARASGAVLAKHAAASSNPRGVAWLGDAGDGARVAVTHYYDRMIVLHDAAGTVVRKLDTAAYTSAPSGLALIGTSASGKFDGHLAVAASRDAAGKATGAVYIVDLDGTLVHSIDVAALGSAVNGVAHLPGSDKLLVTERTSGAHVIDFDGNRLASYATAGFGMSMTAEASIDDSTCHHVLTDWGSQTTYVMTSGTAGLVAHWRLDESSGKLAADDIGGHAGDVAAANWVPGMDGNALALAGKDVRVGDADTLDLADAYTLALWFRYDGADGVLVSKGRAGDTNYYLAVAGGEVRFAATLGGALRELALPADAFADGSWHHVAVTVDTAQDRVRGYLDGVQVLDTTAGGRSATSSGDLFFGSSERVGDGWQGALDDIRLYDRALDGATVAALHAAFAAAAGGGGAGGAGGATGATETDTLLAGGDDCTIATYADDFASGDYRGSSGTLGWGGAWEEINESDGAGSGDIAVISAGGSRWLRVRDNDGGGEGAMRVFDLSGASRARLTLGYRRDGLDNDRDYVAVLIDAASGSGGEVARISGPGSDSTVRTLTVDLSAWVGGKVALVLLGSADLGSADAVLFDAVSVEAAQCR